MIDYKITLIGWVAFILMLVLFLEKCNCSKCNEPVSITNTVTTTIYDTVVKYIPVKPPTLIDSVYIHTFTPVDTLAILQRYFNSYIYSQNISDTNLTATITDTVTQNKIAARSFTYKLLKPVATTTITNTTEKNKEPSRAFYVGGFVDSNYAGTINVSAGVQLHLKSKNDNLYTIGYDGLQKKIMLGAALRLGHGRD